jgi:hypothetical protein
VQQEVCELPGKVRCPFVEAGLLLSFADYHVKDWLCSMLIFSRF